MQTIKIQHRNSKEVFDLTHGPHYCKMFGTYGFLVIQPNHHIYFISSVETELGNDVHNVTSDFKLIYVPEKNTDEVELTH